jgi:oxaloacetate decarboxylase (Na+ extruding) subunit alpha
VKPVHFVDTTLRDGHMSLWAGAMRTDMMLPVAAQIDQVGFKAMEINSTSFFKKMVRELREDPWERIRLVADLAPRTPLRAILGRTAAAFEFTPASISNLYLERLLANGVREVRISDCSNTVSVWERLVGDSRRVGLKTILNLIFSVSPVHTDDYYAKLARAAVKLRADRICLKDPGGLLTPDRTRILAPIVLREAKGIPVELHTHCNTGLGPLCALEAIKAGIDIINAAIPPLANGSSNPSVFNVAENAIALGFTPTIDLDALRPVSEHFMRIAKREGLPIGTPLEYTEAHYTHQVPGGMISNLRHQLTQMKMQDRLAEVLEETARVREDFGYPIMVTPYSQFVGVQAAMNVILGERYKEVTDQVIQYALGLWGEAESAAMNSNLRDRILASPRARELAGWQAPEPSIEEVRQQFGGAGVSDDELMLRYLAGNDAVAALRAAPPRTQHGIDGRRTLVSLITELAKKRSLSRIRIEENGFLIHMARTGRDGG